jgi:2-dehydropantoate 2-reductase
VKIAVVGCGAVGSYYGAMLSRGGHEVHFLLRSDYEVVRREGVSIQSPLGSFQVQPRCARLPEEIGPSDCVLIGLKTTANHLFPRVLPSLVGADTAVLTLQNGLGNEDQLARILPERQILGGLCFVCLNRLAPGVIRHTDHGQVVLGEFHRPPEARTHAIAAAFREAGVSCKVTDNLERTHWEKLVWNIPFNGLGVAGAAGLDAVVSGKLPSQGAAGAGERLQPCLTSEALLGDERWERLVRELMREVIAAAAGQGFRIEAGFAEELIERTRTMGAYKASTILDYEKGLPLEMETLFLEPLRRAQAAGVEVPRMRALAGVLRGLDQRRKTQ